ncbi:hypothetical protein KIPB_001055 [Kipferlia bialata]|uniref:Uncharacterized protein n=1 Tax=Kipferlia bialata TaxID=797122 RepID=A0A9K3CNB4_9EUKA|nr:hypothetical protein KIPB_001055 [Kipferlia bialata]|eukprot:g1055.t1
MDPDALWSALMTLTRPVVTPFPYPLPDGPVPVGVLALTRAFYGSEAFSNRRDMIKRYLTSTLSACAEGVDLAPDTDSDSESESDSESDSESSSSEGESEGESDARSQRSLSPSPSPSSLAGYSISPAEESDADEERGGTSLNDGSDTEGEREGERETVQHSECIVHPLGVLARLGSLSLVTPLVSEAVRQAVTGVLSKYQRGSEDSSLLDGLTTLESLLRDTLNSVTQGLGDIADIDGICR